MPTRWSVQLAFLEVHAEVGIAGSQNAPIGESGIGKSLRLPQSHAEIFGNLIRGLHGMAHSSIMIRTAGLKDIGRCH